MSTGMPPGDETHPRPARSKEECPRAAAHVVLMAAIRIEQERLDAEPIAV